MAPASPTADASAMSSAVLDPHRLRILMLLFASLSLSLWSTPSDASLLPRRQPGRGVYGAKAHQSVQSHGSQGRALQDKGISINPTTGAADPASTNGTTAAAVDAAVGLGGAPVPAPAPAEDSLPVCATDPLCGNPVSVQWYQAHGWLMWLGFGVFMPVGIITSRHLQTVTPIWFYVHIGCMTLGMACIVSAAGIAFALFDAIPGTPSDDPAYLHVTMGTAVFIMACLNFLMGLARPHKGVPVRLYWYLFHFSIGTVTVLLAWYTIFTGMNIYEANWVIDTGSGLPDLNILKDLFTASIVLLAYVYLLLGRWDYMMSQPEKDSALDGVRRFPSSRVPQ